MSFVIAAPELIESAAQDLSSIGSTLGEATNSAAAQTTSIAAAGADEVSVAIAALFGNHGEEFHALTARAAAFHNEFVGLVKSGAGAYLASEVGNAEQLLAGAAAGPAQPLTGVASLLGTPGQGFFSPGNIAAIEAPYKALVANTEANLQSIVGASAADPHPLLQQIVHNQTGYAQTVTTALQNAGRDIHAGLPALRASFHAAGQALLAGNPNAAADDALQGLENFILPGFNTSGTGPIAITPMGPLGDLLPILGIPGQMAQNLANTVQTLTDFTTTFDTNTFGITFGTPFALALDLLGSPITTISALSNSAHVITSALQTGNVVGAIDGVLDAPANVANGFLNGQTMVGLPPITLDILGSTITAPSEVPFSGILTPLTPITILFDGIPLQLLAGTHIGGIVPALTQFLPGQLAQAIAGTGAA
ncbi:PE family protein [Mycobacterium conspicuum]|jgi:hypothetical protein|uniref:Uncharacterized protein n=1 Tax=Mycobacterium conspicuum TaxID=44010 RepID=A0A1X1SSA4_9MYCO|nr:PE family protein [Mycobacterium conspicuum]ORV33406.1 hypothetical protein AWC00_27610 [Mycobacterium conspicuum]BBZ39451.1 hypothetical protein MCNS_25140 [Mycobacterium conspicuum]